MLGDPKKLRTRLGHGYLLSWKDDLSRDGASRPDGLVERLLADPDNVSSLRAHFGRPDMSKEELAEWLRSGLAGGGLALLRTRRSAPQLRAPPVHDIRDVERPDSSSSSAEEAYEEAPTFVGVEVVDTLGNRPGDGELRLSLAGLSNAYAPYERVVQRPISSSAHVGAGCLHLDFHREPPTPPGPLPVAPEVEPSDGSMKITVVDYEGQPIDGTIRVAQAHRELLHGPLREDGVSVVLPDSGPITVNVNVVPSSKR